MQPQQQHRPGADTGEGNEDGEQARQKLVEQGKARFPALLLIRFGKDRDGRRSQRALPQQTPEEVGDGEGEDKGGTPCGSAQQGEKSGVAPQAQNA